MKKLYLILVLLLATSPFFIIIFLLGAQNNYISNGNYNEKIYVALEAEGRIGVIDSASRKVITSIDLSEVQNNTFVKYTAHNIQVSPNGEKVLVTANVDREGMGGENKKDGNTETEEDVSDGLSDKIFIIDPVTDKITGAIPIEIDAHLAHIVLTSSNDIAYVTLQEKGKLYAVDLNSSKVVSIFDFGEKSEPHGLRILPDDSRIFIALMGKKSMASFETKTGKIQYFPLSGAAVQTAVTTDGQYAFATVYGTKKIAWINVNTNEQGYINLPDDAKGPIQLYPTPDSQYLYVADQGYYFEQSTGNEVYKVKISEKAVEQSIEVGLAPHGVVVDKAGTFVYVTNLLSEDVSIIDTSTNKEVARIPVGKMPNGISIWNKKEGGTP